MIWRLNAALAVTCIAALVFAATNTPTDPTASPWIADNWLAGSGTADLGRAPVSRDEFDAFLPILHRFHPLPPPAAKRVKNVPTRPPLSAFRVLLAIHPPDEPSLLAIESKDPAHPLQYFLRKGEPDRDARITDFEIQAETLAFTVVRGDETCTFLVRLGLGGGAAVTGGIVRVAPETTTAPNARGLSRPGERPERTVKVVPFHVDGGAMAIRVTGVKPGSALADLGLEAGNGIQTVDSEVVGDPGAFLDLLAEGHIPRSITVKRGAAKTEATVVLGGA